MGIPRKIAMAASPLAAGLLLAQSGQQAGTLDWGRARAYFSTGVILSQERAEFSKSDVFAGFHYEKSWLPLGTANDGDVRQWLFLNSFFEARLTSIPVAESAPEAASGRLLASRKAAQVRMGVYAPVIAARWKAGGADHGFFAAPVAKAGVLTTAGTHASDDNLYSSWAVGCRLGHYRMGRDANEAPEPITHIDLTRGRFENFPNFRPGGRDVAGRPWRNQVEGRLRIPGTRFFVIGFDLNAGEGPDDLRFLFGASVDIAALLGKLD